MADKKIDKKNDVEDISDSGPAVGRKIIPAAFRAKNNSEDGLIKRIFLYLAGRSFSMAAWIIFIALSLGIIFTVLVVVKSYLCPDIAQNQSVLPSYCPKK